MQKKVCCRSTANLFPLQRLFAVSDAGAISCPDADAFSTQRRKDMEDAAHRPAAGSTLLICGQKALGMDGAGSGKMIINLNRPV